MAIAATEQTTISGVSVPLSQEIMKPFQFDTMPALRLIAKTLCLIQPRQHHQTIGTADLSLISEHF